MIFINWIKIAVSRFWQYFQPLVQPSSIYIRELPSHQLAVDLFKVTWTSRIPGDLLSGQSELFIDHRPRWAAQVLGGFDKKRVLELGPLEGAHSCLLEQLGADVTAIEGNKLAFQRCLIVKNILGLRATFWLGNFIAYLKITKERFDLVFASGVLYHMQEPIEFLKNICRVSDQVYIWTHYYDADLIKSSVTAAPPFKTQVTKAFEVGGKTIFCHERLSVGFLVHLLPKFCGGMDRKTYWMKLDDIIWCLQVYGFEVVATADQANTAHGPSISIAARRIL